VLAGTFDLDGELAVNPDGGLESFGHPIGASGLRMLFEAWLQLRGERENARSPPSRPGAGSPSRTISAAQPGECVSLIGIVGSEPSVASRVRPAVLSPASYRTRKATA
jgi:acetyl-CoA C-acetyltransferase